MYVRRDSNCQLVDQPNHVNVQDVYGNTFENWCVDFVRTDRFNFPIGVTPTPQVAASAVPGDLDPQFFETPIYAWVEKDGVEYYYELLGYNGLPASQKSWAITEEGRGNANTPWVNDGTSALMAEKYDDFAFLSTPSYFNDASDLPPEATFVKPGAPVTIGVNGGLLYYQGDDELHYVVAGTQDKAQKLQMYLGVVASAPPSQATGCADQDPDNLLPDYIFNTSDNGTRVPELYIKSPLIPGTTVDDAVTLDAFAVLGLESDRDLVLYNASNTQALQLEDATTVVSGTTFS